MNIQIARAGEVIGTFTYDEVEQQIAQGFLNPDDQFWKEGMVEWKPLQHISFYMPRGQTPPPLPTQAPAVTSVAQTDVSRRARSVTSLKVTGFLMTTVGVIFAGAAGALRAESGEAGGVIVCGVLAGFLLFIGFILFVAGRLRQ